MTVSVVMMALAIVLLAMATRRPAERYRLSPRLRRQVRGMGALLLALSFAVGVLAGGGLLDLIEWVLAFGLAAPVVALGLTLHATRR